MVKKYLISILIILTFIFSSYISFSYFTNIYLYFEESRNYDDINGGYGILRNETHFINNGCGDDTILDTLTGLCWPKNMLIGGQRAWATNINYLQPTWNDGTKTYSYPSAAKNNYPIFSFCEDLVLGGNSDWRVAGVNEIFSLSSDVGDTENSCNKLEEIGFFNCESSYWSYKSLSGGGTFDGYAVLSFISTGGSGGTSKTNIRPFLCVRR